MVKMGNNGHQQVPSKTRRAGWNQSHPPFQGGNNFNSSQPSLIELVIGPAKINENINKKLLANDKTLESLDRKIESLSSML